MPDLLNYQSSDLDQILPSRELVVLRMVAEAAANRHLPIYLVGGFVRDMLLGCPATDFDLVIEGDAVSLARALAAKYGGRITTHASFGTARWFLPEPDGYALDFISSRSETYRHPAALPTVEPGNLVDDLRRRDFTINTLALRLDGSHWGELRDDLGALDDLRQGRLRVIHQQSFQDDPTRLFRAVRYEQRYGFQIVPETLSLIPDAYPQIELLSAQRIRHELDLILEEEKAGAILSRLDCLDLLQPVHPVLPWNDSIWERFSRGLERDKQHEIKSFLTFPAQSFLRWHFWLVEVVSRDLESIHQRLHFHAKLFNSLCSASNLYVDLSSLSGKKPSQWVARLDDLPLTAVCAVFLAAPDGDTRQSLFQYLENWRHIRPTIDGHDLLERGLPPGPLFQCILLRLREAWLDGEVKDDQGEARLLDKLIKKI
jgi:tRNA nucleotidyltransferase (CCA-adding enzyme)